MPKSNKGAPNLAEVASTIEERISELEAGQLVSNDRELDILRQFIDAVPDFITIKDGEGRWILTNDFGKKVFGFEGDEYRYKTGEELARISENYRRIWDCCRDADRDAWERRAIVRREQQVPFVDGTTYFFDVIKVPIFNPDGLRKFLIVIGRDITARKIIEERRNELRRELEIAEKLSIIGELAGGVMHDLANIFTVAEGKLSILKSMLANEKSDSREKALIEEAINSIEMGKRLACTVLSTAVNRGGKAEQRLKDSVDPVQYFADLKEVVSDLLQASITLKFPTTIPNVRIKIDRVSLDQILLNLLTNARDAIQGEGEIRVRIANVCMLKQRMEGIVVTVVDTGEGLPYDFEKLSERFFTTKGTKGTGLGLAIVKRNTVRQGGVISVFSRRGKGTSMSVLLPILECQDDSRNAPANTVRKEDRFLMMDCAELEGNKGTVLVCDDDDAIREVVSEYLMNMGFVTIEARDERDVLEALRTYSNIDLVFIDQGLQGCTGLEIMQKIFESYPYRYKVILSSGALDQSLIVEKTQNTACVFLQKPFSYNDLKKAIKRLMSH